MPEKLDEPWVLKAGQHVRLPVLVFRAIVLWLGRRLPASLRHREERGWD